jgi:hypothetical protein
VHNLVPSTAGTAAGCGTPEPTATATDPETADTAFAFAEKLGMHPIRAKDRSSLIVNFADATYHHQWIHVEHSAKQKSAGSSAFWVLVEVEGSDRQACVIETVVIYR